MTYTKLAVILFSLILLLQGRSCGCRNQKACSPQIIDLSPYDETKTLHKPIFEFKSGLNSSADVGEPRYKSYHNSGYEPDNDESGYESSDDFKYTPPISSSFSAEKVNIGFYFKKEIEKMREKGDISRGIRWDLLEDKLTRVVGDGKHNSLYAREDYVVIGLNIYRVAKKICELYGKNVSEIVDDASKFLDYYNYTFIPYYDKHPNKSVEQAHLIKTLETINNALVLYLHNKVFPTDQLKEINQKLRLAENYVGLEDTHYDVTTVLSIQGQKFGLEDKKHFLLTEKQKEKIRHRESEHWFKRLGEFEKKLFNGYVDKFLDGKHYIPTQLRDIIGCRNAYEKNVWHFDKNGNKILLGHYYHSGSLASPNKRTDQESIEADWEITQQNWEQIKQKCPNIVWLSLNRNIDMDGIPLLKKLSEKKIVEDTLRAVGMDQFMNFSINELGTNPIFAHLVDRLPENLPDGNQKFDQNEAIEKQRRNKYCKALKQLKEATKGSKLGNIVKHNFNMSNNYFANLAARYALCKILLRESIGISCKSGKDRTGMMSSWIDSSIIRAHYPYLDEINNPVYKHLVYSGHYQLLASINGGMPGRFGMKGVKGNKETNPFSQALFCKPAGLTEIRLSVGKYEKNKEKTDYKSDKDRFIPFIQADVPKTGLPG